MKLTIGQIAEITGATISGNIHSGEYEITKLLIDSRSMYKSAGTMFCAIRSAASDGHRYIDEMSSRGVRAILLDRAGDYLRDPEVTFLYVKDVTEAIYDIAAYCRKSLTNVIGITGSVGKTVVKEMLYTAFADIADRSPRSWNSHLGVPLSICELDPSKQLHIIEVGIDRVGEMERLERLVKPDIGILTPITEEHDEGFASREEKIAEKWKLFANARAVFYPEGVMQARVRHNAYLQVVSGADFAHGVTQAVARYLSFPLSVKKISDIEPVSTRIDVHEGCNDCVILHDNFTPDCRSLIDALDFMRRRATNTRKNTIILCNPDPKEAAERSEVLRRFNIDRVIDTATLWSSDTQGEHLCTPDAFCSETILIFGSPKSETRRIQSLLITPRHDSIFEINLDAIVWNFNFYRSLVKPTTGMIAMVKAQAYGLGAVEIAKTLQAQGAAYLAVAVVDEGVELRRAGVTMPILVLNPITGNYRALFDNQLEPSVFSVEEYDTLAAAFAAIRTALTPYPIHIKLDTGMHRVGFTPEQLPELIDRLRRDTPLRVVSLFSHLATADCPDMNDYTQYQLHNFESMTQSIMAAVGYPVRRHILNTAGIARFAPYQYDMVRLGIGLYGIDPVSRQDSPLHTVASLKSTIISLKRRGADETIGYGRKGVLSRDSLIATVPIGYADGIDRHLGNGKCEVYINGVLCPTIGNICMDQCMIDVTDVTDVKIGDTVEFFGSHVNVCDLADILTTIPYELLTSVAPRVKRVYFRE